MKSLLFILLVLLISACSNSEWASIPQQSSSVGFSEDSLSGMLCVKATGAVAVLGTNSEEARASEQPLMQVKFSYDFSLGDHEVTCGEFNSLMKPATGIVLDCESKNFPATNVTYYDAILYANERSKAEGFDTAYTYTSAKFDVEKHCTNLDGFAYHPTVKGFRLPTEAEWILVASQNWNTQNAWTAENSDYKLHDVCSRTDSSAKICDMAGNAMEWVNDWLGNFRDTTLENYVGAPDGGALGQRVVKGGSYRNMSYSITLYARGDVYTVASSTRADYVGFRLAFGSIPDAVWMGVDGRANSSRMVPLANSSTIHSYMQTYKVKLAFRNDLSGNLAYIDYSSGVLSVIEIADTIDSYHPEISPDGRLVAFCTGLEGLSGESSVYVRDLNANGSNLVKLDVESAAIPRWRVLENGDTVIVYVTSAENNENEATFKKNSTWQVKFSNGKFGTPEKLFDGAYHGGVSVDNRLAVTGARLLRTRVDGKDAVWYKNGDKAEQACNVALSKDDSKRTLFLDFGGKTGQSFVGKKYRTHERLLIADSTGKLIQSVSAPSNFLFDHSEWVNGKNMAVATLSNANGAHQKIVLVDVENGKTVDLLEGDEVWHPSMWADSYTAFDMDASLDLDSAGVYLQDNNLSPTIRYRIKMELYWKNIERTNVILVGSSRIEMGMNPDLYPEWNMINFGIPGIDPNRDFYFVENYMLNHLENLKAIVLSLDMDNWNGLENHLWYVLAAGPGYQYDANHGFWKDGIPKGFIEAVQNSYPPSEAERELFSERGNMSSLIRDWLVDPIEVVYDSMVNKERAALIDSYIERLVNIVNRASEQNVYVVGVIFPQAPQFKNTGSIGLYGLQRSYARKLISRLDSIDKANKYFVLMDENKMGDHDYTDKMAFNRDHLSDLGAEVITARLDSLLKTLTW